MRVRKAGNYKKVSKPQSRVNVTVYQKIIQKHGNTLTESQKTFLG